MGRQNWDFQTKLCVRKYDFHALPGLVRGRDRYQRVRREISYKLFHPVSSRTTPDSPVVSLIVSIKMILCEYLENY